MTYDIYVKGNRASVVVDSKMIVFVIWDMNDSNKQEAIQQLNTALNICSGFDDVERQMKLNGFDCELENINNI